MANTSEVFRVRLIMVKVQSPRTKYLLYIVLNPIIDRGTFCLIHIDGVTIRTTPMLIICAIASSMRKAVAAIAV